MFQPGDEAKIVEVLEEVFEGWPKFDLTHTPLDYWNWKYQENVIDKKLVVVTEINDKIIGVGHTIPLSIKILEDEYLCGLGGDVAVLEEYRKRGVRNLNLKKQREARTEAGLNFTYAITSNPIVIDMFERSPDFHRFPFDLTQFVKIKDLDLYLKEFPTNNKWIKKLGYHALRLIGSLTKIYDRSKKRESEIHIKDIKEFDNRIDVFWDHVKLSYDLIIVKNRNYLNWKYCDPRAGVFALKIAEEEGRIIGFMALRINRLKKEYPFGYIADFLTHENRADAVESLIGEAIKFFDANDVNIINFMGKNGWRHNRILRKHGFVNSRKGFHIYYSPLKKEDVFLKIKEPNPNRIHLCYADLDVI